MANNMTGSPVEGDNFFGRDNELKFGWNHIQKGNHLLLSAPRRVGKTSFAKRLLVEAKQKNWNTLELNLEKIKTEQAFVQAFVTALQAESSWYDKLLRASGKGLDKILSSFKPSFEYEGFKGELAWQSQKADIYEELAKLLNPKEETLIFVDELTVLLGFFMEDKENGKLNVEFFLNWLRSFRMVSGTKIRWVFCSSVSVENFLEQHQLSYTFNDVTGFPIGAFDEDTTLIMLEALAKSDDFKYPDEVKEAIIQKLGWLLPYFTQILHFRFNCLRMIDNKPINIATLDEAYRQLLTGKDFDTWDERLKDYGVLEAPTRKALKQICQNPEGESKNNLIAALMDSKKGASYDKTETTINRVLRMLQNDGYLVVENTKYLFRSPLLRDFWYNRFPI